MMENNPNLIEEEFSYKKLLTATIVEFYPKYMQENLLKGMEKKDVLSLKKRKNSIGDDILDLSDVIETTDQISQAIDHKDAAVKYIEKDEFFRPYKYSAIFLINEIDGSLFEELVKNDEMYDFFDPRFNNDFSSNKIDWVKPTMYSIGNTIMLKFSKTLTGYNSKTGVLQQIKYPIIAIYSKSKGILEIRLDSTRSIFRVGEHDFYEFQIHSVLNWFTKKLQAKVSMINFPPIIEFIKNNRISEVVVDAQSMAFRNGGKAVLENGINDNYVLPLLGELKELIKANEELFDKSPEIKVLIDRFITEAETLSDLPWVTLLWKSDKTKVKFIFGTHDDTFTILQYYGRKSDMEKMDYVTQYIIDNRELLKANEEIESSQTADIPLDNQVV